MDSEYSLISTVVSRRRTLDLLAGGGLAAALGGLAGPARAAEDEVVRIGYLPITDAAALLVAHGMGFFEQEGLKSEPPTLLRGWAPLAESFAAGKFNLVHLLKPIPVWMRYNNRVPVKIVAWGHTNGSGLVVGGATGIASFADLGGRQIAVPFWYSMHNVVLQLAIRAAGLTPVIKPQGEALARTEVNLQVLQPPEMPAALAAGKIDGYIVAEPFDALGELKAGGRILRFTGDIWKNHPCCVITMHEADTVQRPEWSQKVVNAVVKAQAYAAANKREVARLISQDGKGYLPMPAAVIERAMTHYDDPEYDKLGANRHRQAWGNGRIDFQPWPYPSATRLIVEAMGRTVVSGDKTFLDRLDPDFVVKDLVNYDFVRRALPLFPDWAKGSGADGADPYSRVEVIEA
jgi:NitT/TauT family transport system substrate-binding protein